MTSLQQLLRDEAASAPVPMAPVNRIVRTGQARVRRRRLGVVTATVGVMLALTAVAAPRVLSSDHDRDPVDRDQTPGAPTLESAGVAWAESDTIHYRGAESERPGNIQYLSSTASAAVFTRRAAAQDAIFTLDSEGTVRHIGSSHDTTIALDPTGDLAAWTNGMTGLVVYDTSSHEVVARRGIPALVEDVAEGYLASVIAVEGDVVTYATPDGLFRWDIADDRVQSTRFTDASGLLDWRADQLVIRSGASPTDTVTFGADDAAVRPEPDASFAELSPDGRHAVGYFTAFSGREGWSVTLHTTADGAAVPLEGLPGEPLMAGWTADGSLVVVSTEAPWGDLGPDSPIITSLCETNGQCLVPSDAVEGTLGETLVQAGTIGPMLLNGAWASSGSAGEVDVTDGEPTTRPPDADQP